MSTIRVVNIQHPDSVEPNVVLKTDGTAVFVSGITISGSTNLTVSGTAEFASGTAANPGITFIDDNDTGIYSPAANEIAITTNGTQRLRVDNTGQVGIGTSSPSNTLQIAGSNSSAFGLGLASGNQAATIKFNTNGDLALNNNLAKSLIFSTSNAERMRINSSGDIGIGTSSPIADITILGINGNGQGGTLCLQNTATGLNTNVALYLTPNNGGGNDLQRSASIKSRQDVSGNYATLEFYTAASNTPTERARFDSSGRFMIGKTTWGWTSPGFQTEANNGQAVTITNDGSFSVKHCLGLRRDNSDGSVAVFYRGGVQVGSINVTGTNTSYVTSSDYRLKENIIDIDGAINRVKQLAPKRFNFIADADTTVDGFLAHEAQAIVPEAVTGTHNEVDDEGNPVMQGIDQAKLVPLLTAALQEAVAKIETLEQRLTDAGL